MEYILLGMHQYILYDYNYIDVQRDCNHCIQYYVCVSNIHEKIRIASYKVHKLLKHGTNMKNISKSDIMPYSAL